ncbi:MAG: hypothetical protein V2B18_12520 [Pseudomonadota bacterium]
MNDKKKLRVIGITVSLMLFAVCAFGQQGYVSKGPYKFYYEDVIRQKVVEALTANVVYWQEPFAAASTVLGFGKEGPGTTSLGPLDEGFIPVHVLKPDRPGLAGGWWCSDDGSKKSIANQGINLYVDGDLSQPSLDLYGSTLAHETCHLIYGNHTRLYERDWFWTDGNRGSMTYGYVWDTYLTEALAHFTGSCYYSRGPQYSKSEIEDRVKGKARSWADTGYRYEADWSERVNWELMAIGWFLYDYGEGKGGNVKRLVNHLAENHNGDRVFDKAYMSAYSKYPGHEQTSATDEKYLYHYYWEYWNGPANRSAFGSRQASWDVAGGAIGDLRAASIVGRSSKYTLGNAAGLFRDMGVHVAFQRGASDVEKPRTTGGRPFKYEPIDYAKINIGRFSGSVLSVN